MTNANLPWGVADYTTWSLFQLFRCLPIRWSMGLASGLGTAYAWHAQVSGKKWFARLDDTLERLARRRGGARPTRYEVLRNTARAKAEFALVDRLIDGGGVAIEGLEHIRSLTKPIVFVGAHIGNWELQYHALVASGIAVTALYDPPASPAELLIAQTTRNRRAATLSGTRLLAASPTAARELLRTLEGGQNLWIAVDEFKHGLVWNPRLGRTLPYAGNRMLASRLAVRTGAALVPIRSRRISMNRHQVTICPPLKAQPTGNVKAQARQLADDMTDLIEDWVLQDFEQWFWIVELRLDRPFPTAD